MLQPALYENKERCVILGEYIIGHNATVRKCAERYGISKSTVHKDVTTKLKEVNYALYREVTEVLAVNKQERHIRGGEATRKKYLHMQDRQEK